MDLAITATASSRFKTQDRSKVKRARVVSTRQVVDIQIFGREETVPTESRALIYDSRGQFKRRLSMGGLLQAFA